ncbi:hypothetical protein [Dyadobacter sp. LHD-138]|uniref:hypothetical protein n=1 Tax=Dyadobacter sp. LHD-138 TaxID=3071413 RepID=UPI0027E0CCBA|nr:hypothetical protein [Dyadobacter sp. LHD-138]MDQ6482350.1 hypothetical protein [Dyadobacter sp. LHD-138]
MAILLILAIASISCSKKPVQVGHINMISNRNVSSGFNYELLQRFSNSSIKQIRRNKARTINDAIDIVVKTVPGGEYLMNAKVYRVGFFFSVEGDVWGVKSQNDMNGLKSGDTVFYKKGRKSQTAKIISFKDLDNVNIQLGNGRLKIVSRDNLILKID